MGKGHLKLVLSVYRGEEMFVDHVDLYDIEQRRDFVEAVATECGLAADLVASDLASFTLHIERRRDCLIEAASEQQKRDKETLQ